jgi:futalosine hydrolase
VTGLLLVTAVEAEADALRRQLDQRALTGAAQPLPGGNVHAVGVGPAAAAAGTARLLAKAEAAGAPYRAVVCAGIAGGYPDVVGLGATVLASGCVAADLGAQSPDGFLSLDALGFGSATTPVDARLLAALGELLPAAGSGLVLTVSTVTGTAEGAAELRRRHPTAVAEAMEGYGVGVAATAAGVPFAELRTIANPVGPRDRPAWRLDLAFAALAHCGDLLGRGAGRLAAWH